MAKCGHEPHQLFEMDLCPVAAVLALDGHRRMGKN